MEQSPIQCKQCDYIRLREDSAPEWQCPNCKCAYNKLEKTFKSSINIAKKKRPSQKKSINNLKRSSKNEFNPFVIQVTACISSFLLLLGLFLPLINAPFGMSISLMHNGKGDGIIVLVLSIIYLASFFIKYRKLTMSLAFLITAIVTYDLYHIISIAENKFISLGTGVLFILIGAVGILISSFLMNDAKYFTKKIKYPIVIACCVGFGFFICFQSYVYLQKNNNRKQQTKTVKNKSILNGIDINRIISYVDAISTLSSSCKINVEVYKKANDDCSKLERYILKIAPEVRKLHASIQGKKDDQFSYQEINKINMIYRKFEKVNLERETVRLLLKKT